MQYRPEIDGLRAVAVVPVILFHAGFELFSGGYVGVDVFFVISGYLITTIIAGELAEGRFSLRRFYERRARRILPALFFVMLCCLPFAWMWMLPAEFKDFSHALIAVSFFASNILFWRQSDYFAPAAEENPLLHTWSLAVEEQFYIGFPILMLIAWRFGRNPVFWTVAGLSLLSLMLAEWGWRTAPDATFYLLPTRAWELGAGALCALWLHGRAPQARPLPAGLGLGLIVTSVLVYDAATPFPSLYALAPVGGTVLIILYGGAGTLTARLLSGRLMVGIGLISYSAYLWHQPLFAFARLRSPTHPSAELMALLAVAALGLAWLSWRHVELPFRRRPRPALPAQRTVFAASGLATAAVIALGLFGHATDGREELWRRANPDLAHMHDLLTEAWSARTPLEDGECRFHAESFTPAIAARLRDCHARHGPGEAVFGDSHARDLYNGVYQVADSTFIFGLSHGGCDLHTPTGSCEHPAFLRFAADNPEIFAHIFYTQAGFHLLSKAPGELGREIFTAVPENGAIDAAAYTPIGARIEMVRRALEMTGGHPGLIWVGPKTEPHIGRSYLLAKGCAHPHALRPGIAEVFTMLDGEIARRMQDSPVTYLSQIEATGLTLPEDFTDCGTLYWRDGDHWSYAGAARFTGRLFSAPPIPEHARLQ